MLTVRCPGTLLAEFSAVGDGMVVASLCVVFFSGDSGDSTHDQTLYFYQFAISGETESFGSNNLMGQWLKAIGGFSVEQIGEMGSGFT